jgi:PTS system nitrogen regulatory IIA component
MELKLNELAQCLQMPVTTIERWIRQGRIPVKKVGDACVFSDTALKKWARTHNLSLCLPGEKQEEKPDPKMETLSEAIGRGGIYYDIAGDTVEQVIDSAVSAMQQVGSETARRVLYESLVAREQMMSTGIGNGVAVPHPRTPLSNSGIADQMAACFLEKPVDFKAVDKKPVHVLFVLVATTARQHLHLLSRLSFCLRDNSFLAFLSQRPEPETLRKKMAEFDQRLNNGE